MVKLAEVEVKFDMVIDSHIDSTMIGIKIRRPSQFSSWKVIPNGVDKVSAKLNWMRVCFESVIHLPSLSSQYHFIVILQMWQTC